MDKPDVVIAGRVTDLPFPETTFIDAFCDTWISPEDIQLSQCHYGYEGRLMDAARIRQSFEKALVGVFPEGMEKQRVCLK